MRWIIKSLFCVATLMLASCSTESIEQKDVVKIFYKSEIEFKKLLYIESIDEHVFVFYEPKYPEHNNGEQISDLALSYIKKQFGQLSLIQATSGYSSNIDQDVYCEFASFPEIKGFRALWYGEVLNDEITKLIVSNRNTNTKIEAKLINVDNRNLWYVLLDEHGLASDYDIFGYNNKDILIFSDSH